MGMNSLDFDIMMLQLLLYYDALVANKRKEYQYNMFGMVSFNASFRNLVFTLSSNILGGTSTTEDIPQSASNKLKENISTWFEYVTTKVYLVNLQDIVVLTTVKT